MAKHKKDNSTHSPRIVNRRARHDYHVLESLEVGIKLLGSEVKSIREGQASLAEGFARIDNKTQELYLLGVNIAPYSHAGMYGNHEPTRPRKLLAHRRQIRQWIDKMHGTGLTLVPLTLYFVRGKAKIELGLVKGKQAQDKRQDLKKRESDREIRRALTKRVL